MVWRLGGKLGDVHAGHGQRAGQLEDSLAGVEAFTFHGDDDEVFG